DHPGMTGEQKGLPSFVTAGLFGAREIPRPLRDATLTETVGSKAAPDDALGDDLGGDAADTGTGQADRAGSARGQVEHAATDERATIIDGNDDAAAAMGHPQLGAEGQGAVGRRQGILVETLTGGG